MAKAKRKRGKSVSRAKSLGLGEISLPPIPDQIASSDNDFYGAIGAFFGTVGIFGAMVFLSPNLTGLAIVDFATSTSNLFGVASLLMGLIGFHAYLRKK